jgi:hypothetical protein
LSNRTDGDISILWFNQNTVSYNNSVDDPFFLTGDNYTIPVNGREYTLYAPAYYVNMMGCIEQHRFCNPTIPGFCTPYMAYLNFGHIPGPLTTLKYNPTQIATAERIVSGLEMTLTFNSVSNRRGASLLASKTLADLLQTKNLPVDQWRIEVANWFAVSLAKLQQGVLEFAAGPLDPEIAPYVQYPTDTDAARQCDNQLVQLPAGYTNFDFGAILVVTCVGALFFVVGMLFEAGAGWCVEKRGWARGLTEWREDGKFQLLKKLYEAQTPLGWQNPGEDFPITLDSLPSAATAHHAGSQSGAVSGSAQGSSHALLPAHAASNRSRNVGSGHGNPVAPIHTGGAHISTGL